MFENIKMQLKTLPECPGVYLMKDEKGHIIYVGKSKTLKNRVSSYFTGINSHAPKVRAMVNNIRDFEYIITDTEMEALILEQTLIKKHKPRFNILLRDDKQYPYIKVTVNEEYPRVFMTRRVANDKAIYYGPYTNVEAVKKTLEIIHNLYPIRKCSKSLKGKQERPCLNYHINLCGAPCNGLIEQSEYMEYVDKIVEVLSGKSENLVALLKSEMNLAAENLNFEKAAQLRDYLQAIDIIMEKQSVIYDEKHDIDCIGAYSSGGKLCFTIFFVRGGKLIGRDNYVFENMGVNQISDDQISDFVGQYYAQAGILPKEVVLSRAFEGMDIVAAWLTEKQGKKLSITVPKRGSKKALVDLVLNNAAEYMDKFAQRIDMEMNRNKELNHIIRELTESSSDIFRIEAYDISNISGAFSVGTMVVFENWKKKTSDYRKYKIKSISGADDYGSMEEVLTRRFERYSQEIAQSKSEINDSFLSPPDLILIDGGKGHVSVCEKVLRAMNLDIAVAGMVKDDSHRTERLYLPNNNSYFNLKENMELYRFITSVQDEVHRFSVEYHRQLRSKDMVSSLLDDIEGIGEKRKKALLQHFGSVEAIKKASLQEIEGVKGMTKTAAIKVFEYFTE